MKINIICLDVAREEISRHSNVHSVYTRIYTVKCLNTFPLNGSHVLARTAAVNLFLPVTPLNICLLANYSPLCNLNVLSMTPII